MSAFDRRREDGYEISTDRARLERETVHRYLSEEAYWSPGIARADVDRAIDNSLNFGLYAPNGAQAGFARVVGDTISFGWLADVFVLPDHRGRGLGKWLLEQVLDHPDVHEVRRFMLATADAHGLYARYGWRPLERVERWMLIDNRPPR